MSAFEMDQQVKLRNSGYGEFQGAHATVVSDCNAIGDRQFRFYGSGRLLWLSEEEFISRAEHIANLKKPLSSNSVDLAEFEIDKVSDDRPVKVYLAGPMTGIEHYNFPAFKAAAAYLRSYGYEVFNPAENDLENGFDATGLKGHEAEDHGFSLRNALKQDLSWICDHADVLALLDGHEQSRGVAAEVALAKALGLRQFHFTRLTGGIPA